MIIHYYPLSSLFIHVYPLLTIIVYIYLSPCISRIMIYSHHITIIHYYLNTKILNHDNLSITVTTWKFPEIGVPHLWSGLMGYSIIHPAIGYPMAMETSTSHPHPLPLGEGTHVHPEALAPTGQGHLPGRGQRHGERQATVAAEGPELLVERHGKRHLADGWLYDIWM